MYTVREFAKKRINSGVFARFVSFLSGIYNYTEEIIPDEYFYSFYLIPLAANLKCNEDHYKELIVFITSVDGKFVYDSGILTFVINSLEYYSELENDIAYCADDVPIYFDYCNGKFQDF